MTHLLNLMERKLQAPKMIAMNPQQFPEETADEAIVAAESLSQRVPTGEGMLEILSDVSLRILPGETVAVVGASGSGKSTLLGLLAGLDRPSSGEVRLFGHRLGGMGEDERARLRIGRVGFVFQSFQLLPALTALENVMLPLDIAGFDNPEERAREWLSRVGLGARLGHSPLELSGGEQQRVAIARAFATEPELLFADEPTGNLDRNTGRHTIDLLFSLNEKQGTTLVVVTHDEEVACRCRRRLQLDAGRLSQASQP
jgi:putative ABC transport system ATP-binding protein